MKKVLITLMMCFTLLISLVACGDKKEVEAVGDWWLIQDDSLDDGIPLLTIFEMSDDADIATQYDIHGQKLGEIAVSREDDEITLDLGFVQATFLSDDSYLYDLDSNEIVFYRTDDPGFMENASYDGKWYLNGDLNSDNTIEITDQNYVLNSMFNSESGSFTYGPYIHIAVKGAQYESSPVLEAEFPGPTFYPIYDGHILYAQPFMDYECYIHEDYVDDEMAKMYARFSDVLNATWVSEKEDYHLFLNVNAYYFQVLAYAIDENGIENPNEELGAYSGTWSLNPSTNEVTFTFNEGGSETFLLEDDLGSITLSLIDSTFERY